MPAAGTAALCLMLLLPAGLGAQTSGSIAAGTPTWDDFVEEYLAAMPDDDDGATRAADELAVLAELHAARPDLHTLSREDLLQLPFLSEAQADSIVSFCRRHGPLSSAGDLLFVAGLDQHQRRWLPLFVRTVPPPARPDTLSRPRDKASHLAETRLDLPLYRRQGDRRRHEPVATEGSRGHYAGTGVAHTARYRLTVGQRAAAGVTLQKDAGEPFGRHGNYPYDYVSAYARVSLARQRVQVFAGDYEVRTGQGLVAGRTSFSSKRSLIDRMPRALPEVRSHTSVSENGFLRGAAVTLRLGSWATAIYVSSRRIDATLDGDTVTALPATGLHRTHSELERRRAARQTVAGAHAAYVRVQWHVGLGATAALYDHVVWPPLHDYNRYWLRGRQAAAVAADYAWCSGRWSMQGEVAADRALHLATTHTLRYADGNRLAAIVQGRALSPRFVSPMGHTVQENSHTANEIGLMAAARFSPVRRVTATLGADFFRLPSATFRASGPANGAEVWTQAFYRLRRGLGLALRYTWKTRQQDVSGYYGVLEYRHTNRLRLQSTRTWCHTTWVLAADGAMALRQTRMRPVAGWMISSRVSHHWQRWKVAAAGAAFHADDYDARLYATEPQLELTAAIPSYSGRGLRTVAQAQWQAWRGLTAALRCGVLRYFDRPAIGTGAQRIGHPTKADLSLQLLWQL